MTARKPETCDEGLIFGNVMVRDPSDPHRYLMQKRTIRVLQHYPDRGFTLGLTLFRDYSAVGVQPVEAAIWTGALPCQRSIL
jgi:hypothetical protein